MSHTTLAVKFTTFDDHCQALYEAAHEQNGVALHHQQDRGVNSSYALVSYLINNSCGLFALVQIDNGTARVESWEEQDIQAAIDKLREQTKCRPDTLLKCLQALNQNMLPNMGVLH